MRILLGDPDSQVVADRGDDEGIGDTVPAKVRNALALYRPLRQVEGVEFRLHRTVLYNSIYRADDQVLVNTHVFGLAAAQAPAWHLRKLPGGELASLYIDSFERVWETATLGAQGARRIFRGIARCGCGLSTTWRDALGRTWAEPGWSAGERER